jgi:molybdopterin converting factor small subunit
MVGGQKMKIRFYGRLADVLGSDLEVDLDECSVAEVRKRLIGDYPQASHALGARVRACVNDRFVSDNDIVATGSTVEFLPVISGG